MKLCLLAICSLLGAESAAARIEAVDLSGKARVLESPKFPGGWKIAGVENGKPVEWSAQDLVTLRLEGKRLSDAEKLPRILLPSGEVVRGEIFGSDEEKLTLKGPALGQFTVPLTAIRAVLFDPTMEESKLSAGRSEGAPSGDRILLKNGDDVFGSIVGLDNERILIRRDGDAMPIARDLIGAVVFDPTLVDYKAPADFFGQMLLVDGGRINLRDVRSEADKLRIEPFFPGSMLIEPKSAVEVSFRNGRVAYLSDLAPLKVETEGFADLALPPRMDRSVLGGPLVVGDRPCSKGIGVKSRTLLVYPALGYARFEATVGLDPSAGRAASVRFQVLLDGKVAFDSGEMDASSTPRQAETAIGAAKTIGLLVDFERRGDSEDFANWCDARLVRAAKGDDRK